MPPKRKQQTANPEVEATSSSKRNLRNRNKQPQETVIPTASSSERNLRSRNKQPQETTIPAVAVASSPKRNQRKRKQSQETTIPLASSSALSSRRKHAKQFETTIPTLASGFSTPSLPEPMMGLTYDQAQMLVRQLMTHFSIRGSDVEDTSTGASFSRVKYAEVAHRVGLEPRKALQDIPTFEIYRSRIPTDLFREILEDLDTMLLQYGQPDVHKNEEARARFFSPIFNLLVKQFTFMLRNEPETMVSGRIGTKDRVEYFFKAFGAVVILCIEMKLRIGNEEERLDMIAQVIAECDACEYNNGNQGYSLPVHCILSDGITFSFFKFKRDRSREQSLFFRGCFRGDPAQLRKGLVLPDTDTLVSTLPFILQLRCICETVFDIMLNAYISAIKAFHDRSISKSKNLEAGMKRPSLDSWDQALKLANDAVATLREAENQRAKGDLDSADKTVFEGLRLLEKSTGTVSNVYKSKLYMTGWDEDEVRKA